MVAEFGGTPTELDLLRLCGTEFVGIADIIASDVQTLSVNDGGLPGQEVVMFEVDSTTGNTILGGNLGVGLGYNRLTVNGNSGDTNMVMYQPPRSLGSSMVQPSHLQMYLASTMVQVLRSSVS